eukprot:scpid36097/ scgid27656/ 
MAAKVVADSHPWSVCLGVCVASIVNEIFKLDTSCCMEGSLPPAQEGWFCFRCYRKRMAWEAALCHLESPGLREVNGSGCSCANSYMFHVDNARRHSVLRPKRGHANNLLRTTQYSGHQAVCCTTVHGREPARCQGYVFGQLAEQEPSVRAHDRPHRGQARYDVRTWDRRDRAQYIILGDATHAYCFHAFRGLLAVEAWRVVPAQPIYQQIT